MSEVIIFDDATEVVIDYLSDALVERADDTPVLPRVPTDRPDRFVVVRRTGGVAHDRVIDEPQITVESWGTSDEDAHDRLQLCRGLLLARPYRVAEVSGPGNLPDPISAHVRYSQTFLVAIRGAAEDIGS